MVCVIDRLVVVRALSGFGFFVAKLGLGRFASGGVVVCSKRRKYLDLIEGSSPNFPFFSQPQDGSVVSEKVFGFREGQGSDDRFAPSEGPIARPQASSVGDEGLSGSSDRCGASDSRSNRID
ncbi:hypothetical protein DY000_02020084 [Brassica cretica]|uniref:Uncharacterized protein n=1 Tax=Brassica cretica TaxID=69181 RepID=A0ABQ7EL10_BRACR|nr:hypothetical protein DY000_02020084 [Brassica cretica]